jgi:hypothetical protein
LAGKTILMALYFLKGVAALLVPHFLDIPDFKNAFSGNILHITHPFRSIGKAHIKWILL